MYLGEKYYPLKQTVAISLSFLFASLVLVSPVVLLYNNVPGAGWLNAYGKLISFGGILVGTATSMAWLFCELYATNIKRVISALAYSIVCPLLFVFLLGFVLYLTQGAFLNGVSSPEGKQNLLFIFFMFAFLSFGIYWFGSKNA